jgi:hypothetical protein
MVGMSRKGRGGEKEGKEGEGGGKMDSNRRNVEGKKRRGG